MQLPPLEQGILIKRYKRFLADIDFGDRIETVHCPNPGAMTGLNSPGLKAWCSRSDNPNRKLPMTLELVEADGGLVGINTNRPNSIAQEALEQKQLPSLAGYQQIRREYQWKKGVRFDFLLDDAKDGSPPMLLEIKNVHLRRPEMPEAVSFPDSVTARGSKHLAELTSAITEGYRCGLLFVVQRMDGDHMVIAEDIDPVYARHLNQAHHHGVEIMAWRCKITLEALTLDHSIPIKIPK
jgi:sugar fermentation stimulation protein A